MGVLFLPSVSRSPSWTSSPVRAKLDLGQETKNRAKGNLKCVPKTIMGREDCASPHVSFLLKSVRAQVHLWNIHSLSLSDFSCTEDLLQNWQLHWNLLYSSPEPLSREPPLPLLCSGCTVALYDDLVYLLQRLLRIFASQINICVLYPLLYLMGWGNRHLLTCSKTPWEIGLRQECIINAALVACCRWSVNGN